MTSKWLIAAIVVPSLTAVAAAPAVARHHHGRHVYAHAAHPQVYAEPIPYAQSDQPRMVEVRPGLWISSWDCVTDEGQGRWKPCSTGTRR
jgi:hypothetical protein